MRRLVIWLIVLFAAVEGVGHLNFMVLLSALALAIADRHTGEMRAVVKRFKNFADCMGLKNGLNLFHGDAPRWLFILLQQCLFQGLP